ncbi:uncharacterized protein LOC124124735 isoform X1 [Haliotis rufescens]|uniref:uncharacterized protein LOC124124735 isoform X1 n=2 Tax=Haliotis rufescens TaxID=6454 RepID=UPI00201F39FC|nr:uncharacterized protein LOC124124735 isoform X1 [Haliotis rufescens]XP_048247629.1 uncharacterized protein LOC124124735 isoform X1 [Haliotis rufescens]XP_048247630.1 uncharacterized protein LOC124124735 isoform X1 [Haliotis rufescens]XP_048247632.1 uncharacterized protein LOC124124735 isoform X1 [Haliotis rufescens]XP_048247633.1 uncharacterized protein LOC124124735 isoform X1 [Haliotis rufescens]XP_048247634.1 uncharacterized protein LOC124124735 isoform X1 [Haliotis rufescens]
MAALSYGKRMLQRSTQHQAQKKKRVTAREDAEWWISVGVDKEGFELKFVSDYVGFGVFTKQSFAKGDFLLEYRGNLMDEEKAKELERKHARAQEGCYMFYFTFKDKKKCIDATEVYSYLGRMVNDGEWKEENCVMKLIPYRGLPHLCLFANRDIKAGEELLYDYGDNTVNWRKQKRSEGEEVLSQPDTDDNPFDLSDVDDPTYQQDDTSKDSNISSTSLLITESIDSECSSLLPTITKFLHAKPAEFRQPKSAVDSSHDDQIVIEEGDGAADNGVEKKTAQHQELQDKHQVASDERHELSHDDEVFMEDREETADVEKTAQHQELQDKHQVASDERHELSHDDEVFMEDREETADVEKTGFRCGVCQKVIKKKGGYTVHMQMHSKAKDKYRKPERRCPFCKIGQTQLSRHISKQHQDIPEVSEAMKFPKNSKERNAMFENFRKRGIYEFNKNQSGEDTPEFEAERKGQKDLVCCSLCKGFYSRRLYHRHKDLCMKDSTFVPSSVPVEMLHLKESTTKEQDVFSKEVLLHFHPDEVGKTCQTEPTIVAIGRILFQKNLRKIEKTMETRKSVMNDMRLLSRLLIAFRGKSHHGMTGEDMFRRRNFTILEQAVEEVTTTEGRLKYGLKNSLFYLLRQSANLLMLRSFGEEEDAKASEIEKFIHLLDLNQNILFGDAAYSINRSRQERLRMPEQQAREEEVTTLRVHTLNTIERLMSEYEFIGRNEYVTLRDAVCCRITLFNARRGGEPSRLKTTNLDDAVTKRWIDDSRVEQLETWEKKLFGEMLVAYQAGKGNHLVPVLIPRDCVGALSILTDKDKRKEVGILEENPYVFPNTQQSPYHVLGWDAIRSMCDAAGVKHPELLTASKQRHRISTIYASLEVPTSDREYFYKHMGHSKGVNEGVYQYPLPIQEVTKVGKHLLQIDQGDAPLATESGIQSQPDMVAIAEQQEEDAHDVNTGSLCLTSPGLVEKNPRDFDTKRFKWTEANTRLIRDTFKEWICLPSGNSLPNRKTVLAYLQSSKLDCSYAQLRTKIMNEQNKQQQRRKKRWNAFQEN